jgi:hypothetical protein
MMLRGSWRGCWKVMALPPGLSVQQKSPRMLLHPNVAGSKYSNTYVIDYNSLSVDPLVVRNCFYPLSLMLNWNSMFVLCY